MPEFLAYDFMRRALEAGLAISIVAPTIGIFFVVRRYSAMADTLAHVSLAGVAAGLFVGLSSTWSALIACTLAILGIERIREQRTLASDTVVSLFLFGGLALGVVLLGLNSAGGINVASFLFGSVLTVTRAEVRNIALLGAAALTVTAIFWNPFFAVSLDEDVAQASGMPVRSLNRLLAILGAMTIAISIHVVGVLLIGALMVIPVLAAMQFRLGFRATWAVATVVSVLSVVFGLIASFYLNLASGATVVLCSVAFFLCATAVAKLSSSVAAGRVASVKS